MGAPVLHQSGLWMKSPLPAPVHNGHYPNVHTADVLDHKTQQYSPAMRIHVHCQSRSSRIARIRQPLAFSNPKHSCYFCSDVSPLLMKLLLLL